MNPVDQIKPGPAGVVVVAGVELRGDQGWDITASVGVVAADLHLPLLVVGEHGRAVQVGVGTPGEIGMVGTGVGLIGGVQGEGQVRFKHARTRFGIRVDQRRLDLVVRIAVRIANHIERERQGIAARDRIQYQVAVSEPQLFGARGNTQPIDIATGNLKLDLLTGAEGIQHRDREVPQTTFVQHSTRCNRPIRTKNGTVQ